MHAAAVLKTVPHGVESSTFLGSHIAAEIKEAVPLLHDLDQGAYRRILQSVVLFLQDSAGGEAAAAKLQDAAGDGGATVGKVFTGLLYLVRAAVRNKTKLSVIQSDLTEMNLPPDCVKDFVTAIRSSRFVLEDAAIDGSPGFPELEDLKWRIDVAISTSSLSRALQPSVLMQMTLSNGQIKTFEVPLDKFHELRYNTAKVLKEMTAVESHPVMRIAFDLEKQKLDDEA